MGDTYGSCLLKKRRMRSFSSVIVNPFLVFVKAERQEKCFFLASYEINILLFLLICLPVFDCACREQGHPLLSLQPLLPSFTKKLRAGVFISVLLRLYCFCQRSPFIFSPAKKYRKPGKWRLKNAGFCA